MRIPPAGFAKIVLVGLLAMGILLPGCAKRVAGPGPRVTVPVTGNIIEHHVQPGEDVAIIADDYYGDPAYGKDIEKFNGLVKGARLVPGSVLKLRFDSDQWDEARRRAMALSPYNEGVDLLAVDRLAEAQTRFEQALDIAPGLHSARYNLALVLLKRGKAQEALKHLDQLVTARPQAVDFAFARGNALFQTAEFEQAANQFHALLVLDASNKRAAFGYARSLQEAGDVAAARTAWEAYLKLDPDSGWADSARRNLELLHHGG